MTVKKHETKKPVSRPKPAGATSSAILGRPILKANATAVDTKKIKGEWQKFYNHLLELREQLLHQMNGLAKESAQELPGYSLHMADSGTDNFDRDFALS
ncbi:MAG: transcriptional regulator, partial [Limisphaerales bacterium]